MIAQKRAPALRRRSPQCLQPVATDGLCADFVPERAQLTLDAHRSPPRVLARQPQDQLARLAVDPWPPTTSWATLAYRIVDTKKGISANQLKPMVGVSYKAAWSSLTASATQWKASSSP